MENILNKAERYVIGLLSEKLDKDYLFHTVEKKLATVRTTQELLDHSPEKDLDKEATLLAVWFTNTGFTMGYEQVGISSCEICKEFLKAESFATSAIDKVCTLILAANSKNEPKGLSEKIVKDAVGYYFAHDEFEAQAELFRREVSALGPKEFTVEEWREHNLNLFQNEHRFFTEYAIENWQSKKEENLADLLSNISKNNKTEKKEKLKVNLKNKSPERAIQSLYRVTLRNHLKLSDIADTKANILLSVNAIIISLLLANLIPKLDQPNNSYLIYPTVIFVIFSIASMIVSVLATRPKIDKSPTVGEHTDTSNINYLFFGNFHALDLPTFKSTMRKIRSDKDEIYDALSTDLYYLGIVLKEKYRLLRWTYTIFITGMVLSVIAFAIALKYYGPEKVLDVVAP